MDSNTDNIIKEEPVLTPRPRGSRNNTYRESTYHVIKEENKKALTKQDTYDYQKEEEKIDRDWYEKEEGLVLDVPKEKLFLGDQKEFALFEDDLEKINRAKRMGTVYKKRKSQKAQALEKDQTRWEQNRIESAGLGGFDRVETIIDDEEEKFINILVLDDKPPFLSGKVVHTKQQEPVLIVKDPTSDLAVLAKKGSNLLHDIRKQKDEIAAQKKFWELEGSRQGDALGIKRKAEDNELEKKTKVASDGTVDYKSSSSYSKLRGLDVGGSSDFSRQKSLQQQREFLPIFSVREDLMQLIRDNQVIVVVGETGSGKTTQLTQYLLEEGLAETGMIGCTQPRRVAAMSVAKRVAEEVGCELGKRVGYAIRFEDCTSSETKIKYLTDGVLLRESLRSKDLDDYAVLVMDEAHERSLHTDILFGLLKTICCRRADLKLIVTSATLDADRFADFFGRVPVFTIPGRTFPVDIFFSKNVCEDYLESSIKQILSIHLTQSDGDILVFMTGQEDIEATCSVVAERLEKIESKRPILILPIYSALPSDLQAKVFEKAPEGTRKCVVATNIAETSITLDGIKYVVDSGYCKLKVFNPRVGMDSLQATPISRANANQRSGRAGRTAAGSAYRMYTLMSYNFEMMPNSVPEIQRTNLGNVVLLLKSLGVKNLLEFEFMDPPPQDNILNSMYQLWILGALDNEGDLTELGRHMSEFPLDPALSKMLVFSALMGCSAEVLTIVSVLSVPSIFYRPNDRASESDSTREKFAVPESDHLTLLRVYETWAKKNFSERWCQEHFIHYKAMRRVREVRSQLVDIMKQRKIPMESCEYDYDTVRKSICSAYFHHAAKMKGIGEYTNLRNGMPCLLHPSSGLYGLGHTPQYVVYHELVFTSREYMRIVTTVDPRWLTELGPMFFQARERGSKAAGKEEREAFAKKAIVFKKTTILNQDAAGNDDNLIKETSVKKIENVCPEGSDTEIEKGNVSEIIKKELDNNNKAIENIKKKKVKDGNRDVNNEITVNRITRDNLDFDKIQLISNTQKVENSENTESFLKKEKTKISEINNSNDELQKKSSIYKQVMLEPGKKKKVFRLNRKI